MSDSYTEFNVGSGGTKVDETSLTVNSTLVKRTRVELTGSSASEIVKVLNSPPATTDYGIVVRQIVGATTLKTGRKTISTTAVQLSSSSIPSNYGVQVKAADTNSDKVYVGFNNVTANSGNDSDGSPLSSGDTILLPISDVSLVYAIAASGTQKVFFLTTY